MSDSKSYIQNYDEQFSFVTRLGRSAFELLEPIVPGEFILDLGCGTGHLTADIASRGARVLGLDASPIMITKARKKYPSIPFVLANAECFALHERADAVFSNAALHWMRDASGVLRCASNVLKTGGRFVAEMGAKGNVATIIKSLYEALKAKGYGERDLVDFPWFYPSVGKYSEMLEQTGFEIKYLEYFERPTPLDDCPNGVADWIRGFAGAFLKPVPEDERDAVIQDATERSRPYLYRSGRWFADYKRLRFIAIKRHNDILGETMKE